MPVPPQRHAAGPKGPLGPQGAPWGFLGPWGPKSIAMGANNFKTLAKNILFDILGSKISEKKVGIQAPGPPRRDPGRNSVPDPGFKVPNGRMATHLVAKKCDLGSLGVPGPASTPLGRATATMDPKLDLDLDISDLGFDQISSHKRVGSWRPKGPPGGPSGAPRGPVGAPRGPLGPQEAPWGHQGAPRAPGGCLLYTSPSPRDA